MKQQTAARQEEIAAEGSRHRWKKYRKAIIISMGIIALNLIFGFDARFTIINLLWLLV